MRKPRKPRLPELPLVIIECHILPSLPAKTLARFKCVCKQWKLFISTDELVNMNLHHQINDETRTYYKQLFFLDSPSTFCTFDSKTPNHYSPIVRPIPFVNHPNDGVDYLATLNGLVCVTIKSTRELAIWNPLTRAYKQLTALYNSDNDSIGFYMDSSNDYRLLHMSFWGASIYSRRLDLWREIDFLENGQRWPVDSYKWSPPTFSGGSVYFPVKYKHISNQSDMIIIFDVNSEKFREIRYPSIPSGVDYHGSFMVIEGSIHLCVAYKSVVCEMVGELFKKSEASLYRMDGDMWIKVAFSPKQSDNLISIRHICKRSNGNWIVMLMNDSFHEIVYPRGFAKNNFLWNMQQWSNPIAVYIETLVSPSS